jgi:sec-independent protein translocase protein TatA
MFGSIGMGELLVILLVVLLLFGGKKLPEIARNLGRGYRQFQKNTREARDEVRKILHDEEDDLRG